MSHWAVTWTACWSTITPARQAAIEAYLSEKVENLQPGELSQAVEQLAVNWDSKINGNAPGIGLLITTIKGARKRAMGIDTSEPYEYTIRKNKLRITDPSDLSRWDIVCECYCKAGIDWAKRLECYAVEHGGLLIPPWVDGATHYNTGVCNG